MKFFGIGATTALLSSVALKAAGWDTRTLNGVLQLAFFVAVLFAALALMTYGRDQ